MPGPIILMYRCSLPHRQLRKLDAEWQPTNVRSLPHRQLRKLCFRLKLWRCRSLPHRQLRKMACECWLRNTRSLPHRQLAARLRLTTAQIIHKSTAPVSCIGALCQARGQFRKLCLTPAHRKALARIGSSVCRWSLHRLHRQTHAHCLEDRGKTAQCRIAIC